MTDQPLYSVAEAIIALQETYGLGLHDIALVAGASQRQIRDWRRGEGIPHDEALSRLLSFITCLEELRAAGIEDPAAWMEAPLPLPGGYLIRPVELYQPDRHEVLLAMATGTRGMEAVLDELLPGWRENRSDYVVVNVADGGTAIVPR
jgi:hypothetical protein